MTNPNTLRSRVDSNTTVRNKQGFIYQKVLTTLIATPAANTAATAVISIQSDADFVLQQMTMTAFDVTTFVANPNATVLLSDPSNSSPISDGYVALTTVFGTASLPFILPVPRMIRRNGSLTIAINSNNSTGTVTYYLSFIGHKLYGPV